jgi:hypothetical protein
MAYAEKRGKGPNPWRVKYKLPDGQYTSESGFETKQAALEFGRDEEAKIRGGTWTDQKAGLITLSEWIKLWMPAPRRRNQHRCQPRVSHSSVHHP